ncbi:MAG: hypothetical protein ABI452_05780 [Candidatus Limnocylindrales bacterium]
MTAQLARGVSRWVWLLLALAVASVAVAMLTRDTATLGDLVGAALSTGPLLAAAALVAVAPKRRLVALSALGFAVVPTLQEIHLVFSRDIHDLLRMPQPTYADLSMAVMAALDVVRGFGWLFGLGAVLCLALYIGTVRSHRGWWIVGIGLALAAVQVVVNVARLLPIWSMFGDAPPDSGFDPLQQLVSTILGSLVLVAWAYLTAAAFDRGLKFLAVAGGLRLFESAIGLLAGAAIDAFPPSTSEGADTVNFLFVGFFFVANLAFWAMLIVGILRELPRDMAHAPATPGPAEVMVGAG